MPRDLGRLTMAILLAGALCAPEAAAAQWSQTYEQFYLPGKFNWTFRREYAAADRLFNAFDYGHSILYERLYAHPGEDVSRLETDEYAFITTELLVNPPNLPLQEMAIEVTYAKMAPEAKMMFDWAHLLHRQIYDVLASENMTQAEKDAQIAQLVRYYKSRPDLAFSSTPKNMELMEGRPYSLAFRQRYPKFNGLIWAYHWLQVGLYEPLMVGTTREARQAGVTAAVARFRQMLENAPERMPRVMPMTAAIAPSFAERYPEASIIFDNLHSMHDVVSDILANNDKVSHREKRSAILDAASRYRDSTSFAMSIAEWKSMGAMMGIENMGGPAVGFLAGFATPTLARGATMTDAMKGDMRHGTAGGEAAMPEMPGMKHGADTPATKPTMPAMPSRSDAPDSTAKHAHSMSDMKGMAMPGDRTHEMGTSSMREAHRRMMRDPVIRARVMADTAMRRMLQFMDTTTSQARAATSAKKGATTQRAPAKRRSPMDHSKMPGMKGMKPMPNMPGMKP